MGLHITENKITSDEIPNVATKLDGCWEITDWDHGQLFDRDSAIKAMKLLIRYAEGKSPTDPVIQSYEADLGITQTREDPPAR